MKRDMLLILVSILPSFLIRQWNTCNPKPSISSSRRSVYSLNYSSPAIGPPPILIKMVLHVIRLWTSLVDPTRRVSARNPDDFITTVCVGPLLGVRAWRQTVREKDEEHARELERLREMLGEEGFKDQAEWWEREVAKPGILRMEDMRMVLGTVLMKQVRGRGVQETYGAGKGADGKVEGVLTAGESLLGSHGEARGHRPRRNTSA